jgi:MEDS: MEthanogen/methylotroph, DcmR Sensory domain
VSISAADALDTGYRHEAFFYADADEFLRGTLRFIRDAVADDEPILVVLNAEKIEALRNELHDDSERVIFADMNEVGANPARIIPAWQDFLAANARPHRRVRGIGEPIWAGRGSDELVECHRHEALLNVAFGDPTFWLLCPYDTQALDRTVIDEARATHPFVWDGPTSSPSSIYAGNAAFTRPFDHPLPEPYASRSRARHHDPRSAQNAPPTSCSRSTRSVRTA